MLRTVRHKQLYIEELKHNKQQVTQHGENRMDSACLVEGVPKYHQQFAMTLSQALKE